MIHVSLNEIILLAMVAGVGLLAIIWMVSVMRERRRERLTRQHLIQCRICGFIYENTERRDLLPCPGCGSLNEPTRPSPI